MAGFCAPRLGSTGCRRCRYESGSGGEPIVAARKLDALDQVTLAELSSISARTLSDLERGSGNPTLASLLKVLDTLGLELTVK